MQIFGLGPPAQVIVLQGLSTYTALASAYFFARPVLRGQMSQGRLDLLENLDASDPRMEPLLSKSKEILNTKLLKDRPAVRRDNRRGVACLVGSFVLFSAALGLQIATDPNVWPGPPAKAAQR